MKTVFELLIDTLDEKGFDYTLKNGNLSVMIDDDEECYLHEDDTEAICGLIEYIQYC